MLPTTNVYKTAARPPIKDFDALPIPDRSLVDYEKYNQGLGMGLSSSAIGMQATRGCPYKCAFCHKIWPKQHVYRSAENLLAEVQHYYQIGIRKFSFIDDIFNLNVKNSRRFFQLVIKNCPDIQVFISNGLRGDILTKDYIDLMVEAGIVNVTLALDSGSPRVQKLISKNLDIEKFRENAEYFCKKHPQVILELQTMHGFPTETREEALMTLDFTKSLKWVHIPFFHILKIYPGTDMEKLALENGISREAILRSQDRAFHELPDTLPFDKDFTRMCQTDFLNNYFLLKERLLHILPYQMRLFTEDEILQKYNIYFPSYNENFDDLLEFFGINREELTVRKGVDNSTNIIPDLNRKFRECFPKKEPAPHALKILLLDLSRLFNSEGNRINDYFEPPLGLMYVLTYLKQQLGSSVDVKILKSGIDFDHFTGLKDKLEEYAPDVIGIRTLTFFKTFFHQTTARIREWGFDVPIVTGGPYATSDYPEILQDPNVDLCVLGEGEITFCELIGKIKENGGKLPGEAILKEIPGIAFMPDVQRRKKYPGQQPLSREKAKKILSQFNDDLENE
jgi:radical SAM superfamily enzyme YgiQ (UPF0313 family)